MIELVISDEDVSAVQAHFFETDTEKCAIFYTNQTRRDDGTLRLIVFEIQFPSSDDYARRGALEAELKPEFVARATKHARTQKSGLVFVHSHLMEGVPQFSVTDDRGEKHLASFLAHRLPESTHAALVVSFGGMCSRVVGHDEEIRVIAIGENRKILFDPYAPDLKIDDAFDRQIRAFGKPGQETLQQLKIAIVGLGGTGSLIAEQLVHLGVRKFILADPDTVEESNLNRVTNATRSEIGLPKVEVAAKYIQRISESAELERIQGDIVQDATARKLLNADLIFGCTDSHGSRAILQQIAYQYLIPCIDMGVVIAAPDGRVTHIFGRVQALAPGLACFTCDGLLDAEEVRRDMMTEFERRADPYILGSREPAPAVISLNSTVASLAVTMMLSMVTGLSVKGRHLLYNALNSTIRIVKVQPQPSCFICSRSGSYARADSWPLFTRMD